MKILLINLRDKKLEVLDKYVRNFFPPLNLQILASLAPNEEVKIVDENFDEINFDGDYDLVGLTGYGVFKIIRAKKIYEGFKKRKIPVVIGGPSFSCVPIEYALKCADSIVLGEGEGICGRVVQDAKNKKLKKVYKSKELVDLSKLNTPLPRRDLTNNRNYTLNVVEIARGCPNNCDYCTITRLNKGKYRTFPIKRVLGEVEQCLEYPARIRKFIYFADDNLSIKPDYKIKLFKELIPYNIIWASQCDISIAKNKKLLNVLAKSGCLSLAIGFESINQESLGSANKFVNKVSEYKKAVKTIHDYGIQVLANFMFGLDGDKPGVAKKTLDFIQNVNIDSFVLYAAMPEYGTRFFRRLDKEGSILTKDWSKYDRESIVFKPKNMTPEQLEKEYKWFIDRAPKNNLYNYAKRVLTGKHIPNRNVKRSILYSLLFHKLKNNFGRLYAQLINRTKLFG